MKIKQVENYKVSIHPHYRHSFLVKIECPTSEELRYRSNHFFLSDSTWYFLNTAETVRKGSGLDNVLEQIYKKIFNLKVV